MMSVTIKVTTPEVEKVLDDLEDIFEVDIG
jgi:hypothetical protein